MKITINDKRKIFAIQEEFSKIFPYLKMEFYAKPSKAGGTPSGKIIHNPSKLLGDCRTIHKSGTLTLNPKMTVGELKQSLRDTYDLSIEIFRKSGSKWLETTASDNWTLERQNSLGEEMQNPESQEIKFGNPPMTEER
jgi:hypothetical protein